MPTQIDRTDEFTVAAPILGLLRSTLDDNIGLRSGLSCYDAHRFYSQNGFARASIRFSHSLKEGTS
ncbi:MAG: hypothetical protein AB8B58_06060 [Roseobacter sp.]